MKFRNLLLLLAAITLITFTACDKLNFGKESFTISIDGTDVEFLADSVRVKTLPGVGGHMFEAINTDYWIQVVNVGSDFQVQSYNFDAFVPSGIFYVVASNSYENFTEGNFIVEKIGDEGEITGTLDFKTASFTATEGKFKKINLE